MITQHPTSTHVKPAILGAGHPLDYAIEPGQWVPQEALGPGMASLREQTAWGRASILAQEEERQWIALEVHDRIAQTLASVFQQLQVLESITKADPRAWQVATRASTLTREAIREARNIMNDLHPPVLDEFGVVPLIEEELRRFREDTGCEATFLASYSARPCPETEVAIYRIFHEALINVRRHAHATAVLVSLQDGPCVVQLNIQDDGVGFDVDDAKKKKRVGGLMSMQRRAELAGGICHIESRPGQGASVEIQFPLAVQTT